MTKNGEVFATVTSSSLKDVQDALESFLVAQKKWQQIPTEKNHISKLLST